jgi:ribose 5-phosphate isomerase A
MDEVKRRAAHAALDEIPEQGIIGLGSGSTARLFVEALGLRVRAGWRVTGVPTSESTRAFAASAGIPLLGDDGPWSIDVNVDGADEVNANLDLIKGGGGAHTREKIVNFAATRNIIIVDESKMSGRLGERCAVPVEVLPFAHRTTFRHLSKFGEPRLRLHGSNAMRTDAGNVIYDLATGPIGDATALSRALREIPGVVEAGLFIARADMVIVADSHGVRKLTPPQGR